MLRSNLHHERVPAKRVLGRMKAMFVVGLVGIMLQALGGAAVAQGVNIRDQRPVPNGPTYGDMLRVALEQFVFPARLEYKGVGVSRDRVIVRYLKTNGRGGYWFDAYARYSGTLPPFNIGVAERATLRYDNGGISVDLSGGMKGVLNTRAIGDWLARNLRPDTTIDPVPQGRRIVAEYTIYNDSDRTVRFKMIPSRKEYTLGPGRTFKGKSWDYGKRPRILIINSGREYPLVSGRHKFWWINDKGRIGFDINYKDKSGSSSNPSGSARRTEFVTQGGSRFVKAGHGTWHENRPQGPRSVFEQVSSTSSYIELYDAQRQMRVRLHNHYAVWSPRSPIRWSRWPGSEGHWNRNGK